MSMRVHESERQERHLMKSQVEELHVIEPCDESGGGKTAKSNQNLLSLRRNDTEKPDFQFKTSI
jgi:hypothetical protein